MEDWRDVPGFEGCYQVSDEGRVRSLDRIVYSDRGKGPVPWRIKGKVLAPGKIGSVRNSKRYLAVHLSLDGAIFPRTLHSLVMEAFVGPRPDGQEIRHLDGDPENFRLSNLAYGTKEENDADKRRHGNVLTGGRHPMAKLSESDIPHIREMHGKASSEVVAKQFGVSSGTILMIWKRSIWKHVP